MTMSARWILSLALVAGCGGKDDAPSCTQVVEHELDVAQKTMPGHGDMGALGNKKQMVASCEKKQWTAEQRRCVMAAKTIPDIGACMATPPTN
jgi:hypothetical protein